jgi:SH3-like domain-containing protein
MKLLIFTLFISFLVTPEIASGLCVKIDHASLRAGPGPQEKVDWVVGQNMPLKRLSSRGSWIEVEDLDGQAHWIASSAVNNSECVVIKSAVAHLRQGPGTQFPSAEMSVADKYTPFKKLDRDGDWLQVADEYGEKYWVNDAKIWYPVNRTSVTF